MENKIEDPETLTGLVTKVLTQYGIPGGASFKILNRFKIFQRNRSHVKKYCRRCFQRLVILQQ